MGQASSSASGNHRNAPSSVAATGAGVHANRFVVQPITPLLKAVGSRLRAESEANKLYNEAATK